MLKIRLQRVGKIGKAYFRIVVVEHARKVKGKYLELLGSYDPHKKILLAKKERIDYWMKNGVKATPTLHNLLINHKVREGEKVQSWKPKKKSTPAVVAPASA